MTRVVALGDSVTVGIGDLVEGPARPGWAEHLAVMLEAECVNLARTGARARDVVAEQLEAAVSSDADVATVLVGGNDVLRADFDAVRVGADVRRVCEALTAVGVLAVVVHLHDPARALPGGGGVFGRVIAARAALVNAAVRTQLHGLSGVVQVDPDAFSSTYDRESWHIDRMHPSALGHRLLAVRTAHALSPYGVHAPALPPRVPDAPPGVVRHVAWLVRNGVPWFAKRSVDLIPELVRVVLSERRTEPHLRSSAAPAAPGPTSAPGEGRVRSWASTSLEPDSA